MLTCTSFYFLIVLPLSTSSSAEKSVLLNKWCSLCEENSQWAPQKVFWDHLPRPHAV